VAKIMAFKSDGRFGRTRQLAAAATLATGATVLAACGGGQGDEVKPIDASVTTHLQGDDFSKASVGTNEIAATDAFVPNEGSGVLAYRELQRTGQREQLTFRSPSGDPLLTVQKDRNVETLPSLEVPSVATVGGEVVAATGRSYVDGDEYGELSLGRQGDALARLGLVRSSPELGLTVTRTESEGGAGFELTTQEVRDEVTGGHRRSEARVGDALAYVVQPTTRQAYRHLPCLERTVATGYDIQDAQGGKKGRVALLGAVGDYESALEVTWGGERVATVYVDTEVKASQNEYGETVEDAKTRIDLALAGQSPEAKRASLIRLDAVLKHLQTEVGSGQHGLDQVEEAVDQLRFALAAHELGDVPVELVADLLSRYDPATVQQAVQELGLPLS
jgi:hypothetical protein